MKTKLLILLLILTFGCKAQSIAPIIVPVENKINYITNDLEIPDGIYLKDVNHLLDKYAGTWIGTYDNKTYGLHIVEFTDNFLEIMEDKLLVRYKITDANGNILESTLDLPDGSPYVISGKYLSANEAYYVLGYVGQEGECGQMGDVFIEVPTNTGLTEMKLFMVPDNDFIIGYECPNGPADQILPLDKMTLLKQ